MSHFPPVAAPLRALTLYPQWPFRSTSQTTSPPSSLKRHVFDAAIAPSPRLRPELLPHTTSTTVRPSVLPLYFPLTRQAELHGDPSPTATKLLYVMGLNNSCFAWEKQVAHFGREAGYQVLVFDNRGVGHSDSPKGLYKTSEMALDTVELLDFVGWERDVHVIGVSMGGMVAQELVRCRLRVGKRRELTRSRRW